MKTFYIYSLNKLLYFKLMVSFLLLFIVPTFITIIFLLDHYTPRLIFYFSIPLIFVVIFVLLFYCTQKYVIELSNSDITIKQKGRIKICFDLDKITIIKVVTFQKITVFVEDNNKPILRFSNIINRNNDTKELINTLLSRGSYEECIYSQSKNRSNCIQYINRNIRIVPPDELYFDLFGNLTSNKNAKIKQSIMVYISFLYLCFWEWHCHYLFGLRLHKVLFS